MQLHAFVVVLLLVLTAAVVDAKHASIARGKRPRRTKGMRHRFPRPRHWMLYSSNYDATVEGNGGCFDIRPQCGRWAANDQYCVYAGYFMKRNCRRTCKYCESPIGHQDALAEPYRREGCEDALEDCPKYIKSQEQCNLFSGMTKKYCARTCGFCCTDRILDCEVFIKKPSQCTGLNGFFRKYCPRTCQLCGSLLPLKAPGCADELDDCSVFTNNRRQCSKHKEFCAKYCAKSCGFCDHGNKQPKTVAPSTTDPSPSPQATSKRPTTIKRTTSPPPATAASRPSPQSTTERSTTIKTATNPPSASSAPSKMTDGAMKAVATGFLGESTAVSKPLVPPTQLDGPGTSEAPSPLPQSTASPVIKTPVAKQGFLGGLLRKGRCIDLLVECKDYVIQNPDYCKYHVIFMKKHCSKSCGFCDQESLKAGPSSIQSGAGNKPLPRCEDRRKKKCRMYSRFVGYCTSNDKFMRRNCAASCGFCSSPPVMKPIHMASRAANMKYEFSVTTEWDGKAITHAPIKIRLSAQDSASVRLEVSGPLFNDPAAPPCKAGLPCWQLWDHEVAEVFFLGEKEKYFELEVSPHGPHLLLLLDGVRKPFKKMLPMSYTAKKDEVAKTWSGNATIPLEYFPPGMRKINAYAIHGTGANRKYESLYPADKSLPGPDFHALQFFKGFDFKSMFPPGWNQGSSAFWVPSR